ncbi:helix-turn-helix transcriptional regulator [Acinetobacter sp. MD2]|uniref:helix-turn-helix transcriptional regulator n=1 Tax=Acinetobacter sp. MD2 TaxID=2600066 RepID=UPI002D1F659C|nr:PAS domain-containing protein [Acinetobacter sp. MD2]MEB3766451.1 PAS domain-containing protein [Acinetobacter sp. MD2]
MSEKMISQQHLLVQLSQIAEGLSQTFSPFCEVVVHDLTMPEHAIHNIYNNLSGRQQGGMATELGHARINDPDYPAIIANYKNQFKDGRQVKSTSVGIKNEAGNYVAALCLNVDLSIFAAVQNMLGQFTAFENPHALESLDPCSLNGLTERIDQFSAQKASAVQALKTQDRRELMQVLKAEGFLELRHAIDTIANYLGISRTTVYSYMKAL